MIYCLYLEGLCGRLHVPAWSQQGFPFSQCDSDIPPIQRWDLCSVPLKLGGSVTMVGVMLGDHRG